MRLLLIVFFSAISVFAVEPQAVAPATPAPDNLSIPAQLKKTIDTKKCKAGDTVELKTLEPVLIANGLVMPENTRLHATIVGAASRQNDKPSWLLLMVDRAEWKDHNIALRAFVASQITLKEKVDGQNDSTFQSAMSLPDNLSRRRTRAQSNPQSYPGGDLATHPVRDEIVEAGQAQQLTYHRLDDVRMMQAKNGAVFLVTSKNHLKLPSGIMFMFRNRPVAAPAQAATQKAPGNAQ